MNSQIKSEHKYSPKQQFTCYNIKSQSITFAFVTGTGQETREQQQIEVSVFSGELCTW